MPEHSCTYPGCKKKYKKPAYLTLHENTHKGIRPYKCNKCSKAYYKSSHLLTHRRRVHKEEATNNINTVSNTCPECGKVFASPESKTRHEDTCGRTFNCIYCRRIYTRPKWYILHLRQHEIKSKPKPNSKSITNPINPTNPTNICSICGKSFRLKKNCTAHEKGVHGKKEYQCIICLSYFSYAHTLRRHITQIHSEEKEKL